MPISVFLLLLGAVFFYRLGQHEYGKGFLAAALSLLAGVIALWVLTWGSFGYLGGQLLLFVGMTWYNMKYRPPGKRG